MKMNSIANHPQGGARHSVRAQAQAYDDGAQRTDTPHPRAKYFCALVFLTAAMFVAGCETVVVDHGAYTPLNVTVNEKENFVGIVLLSQRVQNSVACPGIQEARLPDGRLQVGVQLRNRESRRIQVQANCEFKDAQGFVIDSTPFQNAFLDDNAQEGVKFVSMNDKAVRYTIRVREAH